MKKISFLFFCAFFFLFFESGCSNGFSLLSHGTDSYTLTYDYLTSNRNFIGGSLIYDPEASDSLTQIEKGTKIGVRLGRLQAKTVSVNTFPAGTTSITSSETDDSLRGLSNDITSVVSVSSIVSGGSLTSRVRYEDQPEKAVYGYINIDSVSPEAISLTFVKVSSDNSTSSKSIVLSTDESCDLDSDGVSELKWAAPPLKRTGYSDKARYLTFINKEDSTSSAMFYTFSDSAARAGYRATGNQTENIDTGLYAVNSEGDFVWLYYDEPGSDDVMAYGDYIVCLPSKEGFTEDSFVLSNTEFASLPEDNPGTDTNEFLDGVANVETSDSNINFGGKAYVITNSKNNSMKAIDEFSDYVLDYLYFDWQFPDPENGPAVLLSDLCTDESIKNLIQAGENSDIEVLNNALSNENFVDAVLNASVLSAEKKSSFKTAWNMAGNNDRIKYSRILIDELYDASPSATIEGPEMTNIYPDMCLNLGSIGNLAEFLYSGEDEVAVESDAEASRTVHSKWSDYQKRHKELEKEWDRFYKIDLSQVILFPATKGKSIKINPKSAGLYFGAGLRASCSVTKRQAAFGLGFAIWLDLDFTIDSLNVLLEQVLKTTNNSMSESAAITMAEKLMLLFGDKVKKLEIKVADVNINVCGVPLVFGGAVKTGFNFNLGNYNPHLCFSGMYGGEFSVGASYGVEWFLSPYFYPYATGKGIHSTEFYVGLENSSASTADITFEPWICFTPSAGLGVSALSIRMSLPIKTGIHTVVSVAPKVKLKEMGLFLGVNFQPYMEVDLKVVKLRKNFCNLPVLNHNLILIPTPVRITRR